jgi:hypothetical protein
VHLVEEAADGEFSREVGHVVALLAEPVGEALAHRGLAGAVVTLDEDDAARRDTAAQFLVQSVVFVQSK